MEYLIRPLAVALGATLGSAFRHATETGTTAILQKKPFFVQLLIAGGGSFLAGFLAARTSPLGAHYVLIEQPPMTNLVGGFVVGLVGGFAILPAFANYDAPFHPNEAKARLMVLRVVGSLAVSIISFLLGAALSRLVIS